MSGIAKDHARGRIVLLTREEAPAGGLADLLRDAGAEVRLLPLTQTLAPEDPEPLRRALSELQRFDWVALTSARAVRALREYLPDGGPAASAAGPAPSARGIRPQWGCVGPATAEALRCELDIEPALIPERFDAAALARGILAAPRGSSGRPRVLFPAAENARQELPQALQDAGFEVVRITAYRVVPRPVAVEDLLPPAGRESWDAVVLTSALAVQVLLDALAASKGEEAAARWLAGNRPAVFGPSAETALAARGVATAVRAARPLQEEMFTALTRAWAGEGPGGKAQSESESERGR